MSVTFKRVLRKNPQDKQAPAKYYPQVITWGKPATLNTIAHKMTYSSSLTLGDIQSVLTNLVSTLRAELFAGHSVNIEGFGVFSLAATTEGSEKREDCQSDKIKSLRTRRHRRRRRHDGRPVDITRRTRQGTPRDEPESVSHFF